MSGPRYEIMPGVWAVGSKHSAFGVERPLGEGERPDTEKPKPCGPIEPDLDELLAKAQAAFEALSPLEQAQHREAQRQSWARSCITGRAERLEHRKRRIELLLGELRHEIERGIFEEGLTEPLRYRLVLPAPHPANLVAVEFSMRECIATPFMEGFGYGYSWP